MARLACEKKMAFYPTSVKTVGKIKEFMEFEQGAQIVDPCCGEAEAVSVFKDSGRLYGVELDVIRAKKAAITAAFFCAENRFFVPGLW